MFWLLFQIFVISSVVMGEDEEPESDEDFQYSSYLENPQYKKDKQDFIKKYLETPLEEMQSLKSDINESIPILTDPSNSFRSIEQLIELVHSSKFVESFRKAVHNLIGLYSIMTTVFVENNEHDEKIRSFLNVAEDDMDLFQFFFDKISTIGHLGQFPRNVVIRKEKFTTLCKMISEVEDLEPLLGDLCSSVIRNFLDLSKKMDRAFQEFETFTTTEPAFVNYKMKAQKQTKENFEIIFDFLTTIDQENTTDYLKKLLHKCETNLTIADPSTTMIKMQNKLIKRIKKNYFGKNLTLMFESYKLCAVDTLKVLLINAICNRTDLNKMTSQFREIFDGVIETINEIKNKKQSFINDLKLPLERINNFAVASESKRIINFMNEPHFEEEKLNFTAAWDLLVKFAESFGNATRDVVDLYATIVSIFIAKNDDSATIINYRNMTENDTDLLQFYFQKVTTSQLGQAGTEQRVPKEKFTTLCGIIGEIEDLRVSLKDLCANVTEGVTDLLALMKIGFELSKEKENNFIAKGEKKYDVYKEKVKDDRNKFDIIFKFLTIDQSNINDLLNLLNECNKQPHDVVKMSLEEPNQLLNVTFKNYHSNVFIYPGMKIVMYDGFKKLSFFETCSHPNKMNILKDTGEGINKVISTWQEVYFKWYEGPNGYPDSSQVITQP